MKKLTMKKLTIKPLQSVEEQVNNSTFVASPYVRYCTPYLLKTGFIASEENWRISTVKDSPLTHIPTFHGYKRDGGIIFELDHADRYVTHNYMRDIYFIVVSDAAPEYCIVKEWYRKCGIELDTFTLPTAHTLGYFTVTTCLNLLLACQIVLKSSTKLSDFEKQRVLEQINTDYAYVVKFIQQIPKTPNQEQSNWLLAQIPKLTNALLANSRYYWSIVKGHRVSDFNLSQLITKPVDRS